MKRAVLIYPDGSVRPRIIKSLEDMQLAVGGLVQDCPTYLPNLSFFCNEEMWTLEDEQQKLNPLANDLCSYGFEGRYEIVGPVLVMGGVDREGETLGLTPEQLGIFFNPNGEILNALIGD